MSSHNKKILVIGASIAGPALCYWLKHFGFSPTLIERSKQLRKGGYAIDIRGIAVRVAQKMGILDRVYAERTQLHLGVNVDSNGKTQLEEHGEVVGFREGDDVEIVRGDLVDILMSQINGIPCNFNKTITQLKNNEDKVTVSFNDGVAEEFDFVIGADGLHSTTRQLSFEPDEYALRDLGCSICVFDVPNYLNLRGTEMRLEKDEKLFQMTCYKESDVALAAFMFRRGHAFEDIQDTAEQKALIRDSFTDFGWETNKVLGLMEHCTEFYFDSITQVKMDAWTKGRVALVGDAGYCASPMSGQGTSLALVGAYILASELGRTPDDHQAAFGRYNELLRPFVEANQEFGRWVSESFLIQNDMSKEKGEERTNQIMEKMRLVSNAIDLPSL